MVKCPLPYPYYHRKLDQKFGTPLTQKLQDIQKLHLRLYLVHTRRPLQINQILHAGSALCMISVAFVDLGLSIFLRPKLTDIISIHGGFMTS